MSLAPCPDCHRHVRASERACPFCGAALGEGLAAKVIPGATQRLSRAAAFAFTATLSLTACGPSTTPTPDGAVADTGGGQDSSTPDVARPDAASDAVADNGGPAPLYGAPADVPVADTGGGADAVADTGGVMPLYGAPVDAGPTPDVAQNDAARDTGGVAPLYGAVPPPDAATDASADAQEASIGVRYGAPPRDMC